MYADVDPRLHRAAARSVLDHLMHMVAEGRAVATRLVPVAPADELN